MLRPGNRLYTYAYIWLLLPALLFLLGWFKPYISITIGVLLCYGVWRAMTDMPAVAYTPLRWNRKTALCLGLFTIWVLLSGLGGLTWQDTWDHSFRNGVYFDLVNRTWPVTDTDNGVPALLCYYFGFWLPSALIAKLTGSIAVGYIVQFAYGLIGAILALIMVFRHIGTVRVSIVVMFALFCGWDIVAWLLLSDTISLRGAVFGLKDLCYQGFSSPSATTQLYFIYNQGIAVWLVLMLLLRQRNNTRSLLLTYSLLSIYSPIVAAATAPVVVAGCLRQPRQAISISNIAGVLFGITAIAFYMSNSRVGGFGINDHGTITSFLLFIILSYGVFMPFVWQRLRHDSIFRWLFVTMIVLSWTQLGETGDMAWRCTIPASFYLMLTLMQEVTAVRSWRTLRTAAMASVIAIGMLAPLGVVARSAAHQVLYWCGKIATTKSERYPTLFMDNECHDNFIAPGESVYTRYLMRNREATTFANDKQK